MTDSFLLLLTASVLSALGNVGSRTPSSQWAVVRGYMKHVTGPFRFWRLHAAPAFQSRVAMSGGNPPKTFSGMIRHLSP